MRYCCAHHTYYITVYGLPEDMTGGGLKTKREFIYLFFNNVVLISTCTYSILNMLNCEIPFMHVHAGALV